MLLMDWMAPSSPIIRDAAPPKTYELRVWRGSFRNEMGYSFQKKGGLDASQAKLATFAVIPAQGLLDRLEFNSE